MQLFGTTMYLVGCLVLAGTALVGCDTEASGVETCRKIEYARCDAAAHCPATFGVIDSAACHRFYRDHCLHGLPVPDPGIKVNACVGDIKALNTCAAEHEGEVDGSLMACGLAGLSIDPEITTACSLISQPEKILSCSFLNPGETDAGH